VPLGTVVDVIISQGIIENLTIPELVGMDIDDANALLQNTPFTINTEAIANNEIEPGTILTQNPAPGQPVEAGVAIYVTVSVASQESGLITMPNLVGLTEEVALATLINLGLTPGTISRSQSTLYSEGIVLGQNITQGNQITADSLIGIVVSSGIMQPEVTPTPAPIPAPTPEPATDEDEQAEEDEHDEEQENEQESQQEHQSQEEDTEQALTQQNEDEPQEPSYTAQQQSSLILPLSPHIPAETDTIHLVLSRREAGGTLTQVFSGIVSEQEMPINVTVTGSGSVEFVMFVNGVEVGSEVVVFN